LEKPIGMVNNHSMRTQRISPPIAFAVPTAIAAAIANGGAGMRLQKPAPATTTSQQQQQQNTLDEITNKVFSELLQGKVESHALHPAKSDQGSVRVSYLT
jgi:hypothetical protein